MNKRLIAVGLVSLVLVPGLALAVFPVALLPGVALAFESGTLAVSYATAIALVGTVMTWAYFEPPPPAVGVTPAPKMEVRFTSADHLTVSEQSEYQDWGGGEGMVIPKNKVPYLPGVVTHSSTNSRNSFEYAVRDVQRCTAAAGCTQRLGTTLVTERIWVAESAARYLMFTYAGTQVKYDPHNAAQYDGVGALEVGGCPAGYYYFDPATQTCSSPSVDDGVRLQSDGVCSYVYTSDNELQIDPANYAFGDSYLSDPDCYGLPKYTTSLRMGGGSHTATMTVQSPTAIEFKETKKDANNNNVETTYVLKREGGVTKLDGGTFNNGFNTGTGTGDGSAGGGTGSGGSCGGDGQPSCAVDDSGFAEASVGTGLNDALTAMDGHAQAVDSVVDAELGFGWDWLPNLKPGLPVACGPLLFEPAITHGPAAGLGGSFQLDICDKLNVVREMIAWLFGLFTVFYVWRKFVNANGGMS